MQNKAFKITVSVLCALIVATIGFLAGFFTRKATQGKELSRYEWAIETILENAYFGFDGDITETALDAVLDKYKYVDPYSEYYTKEEHDALNATTSGSRAGLGLGYVYADSDYGKGIYISSVIFNSPAYISGLREGEWLKRGNKEGGESVLFDSDKSFSSLIDSAADGENIYLYSETESYVLAKAEYTSGYTCLRMRDTGWEFKTVGNSLKAGMNATLALPSLPDGAGYIKLSQFYGTAASEFYVLMQKFNAAHCSSLILDLRSNGGGFVSLMCDIAGAFTGDGKSRVAMTAKYKNGKEERFSSAAVPDADMRLPSGAKVFVLADAGTASASEALIGAMVCYGVLDYENIFLADYSAEYCKWLASKNREVKTGRTYGKGIMQSTFVNPDTGEALKLTTAQIFWPDLKTSIHGKGLGKSDGCTLFDAEWEHTLPDAALESVLKEIKTRL